jgi:hypothetical protein
MDRVVHDPKFENHSSQRLELSQGAMQALWL